MAIATPYILNNIAELKALNSSQRVNNYMRLVTDPNISGQTVGQPPSWYIYADTNAYDVLSNIIVKPNDIPSGPGRWVKVSAPFLVRATALPASGPPVAGIYYEAALDGIKSYFISTESGVSITSWQPFGNITHVLASDPSFTPHYIGQKVWNSTANTLWIAEGTSSSSDWTQVTA